MLFAPLAPGLVAQPASAPAARLRLSLESEARQFEVGEAIVVRLEVWVSTWFQAPVEFPDTLVVEGALVEVIGGSPDSRFEELDARRWTGLIRRYRILPVQPGALSVALGAELPVQPGGGNGRQLTPKPPPPLRMNVSLPVGAEDIQPFVAASRLELRQRWRPDPANEMLSQVGDLVKREIVLFTDSTSPLLPALDFGAPAGVHLRLQSAEVQEQRGNAATTPTLTRRHEAVYTLHQIGRVELPAVEIVWWDLVRRERRIARVEGLTLDVHPARVLADPFAPPPPAPNAAVPVPAQAGRVTFMALLAMAAGILAAAAWHRRVGRAPKLQTVSTVNPARAWRRLRRACRSSDVFEADLALQDVLLAIDPATRHEWLKEDDLISALTELGRRRFGPVETLDAGWNGDTLWQVMQRLRRSDRGISTVASLPTLHP
jgi:hypothetical protein